MGGGSYHHQYIPTYTDPSLLVIRLNKVIIISIFRRKGLEIKILYQIMRGLVVFSNRNLQRSIILIQIVQIVTQNISNLANKRTVDTELNTLFLIEIELKSQITDRLYNTSLFITTN